jgi:hypothetical protein
MKIIIKYTNIKFIDLMLNNSFFLFFHIRFNNDR